MAETSIEWTVTRHPVTGVELEGYTFNGWWGCTRWSEGCTECYAEDFAERLGMDIWGPGKPRKLNGDKYWNQPLKWNRLAIAEQARLKVFCGSMKDIMDEEVPAEWRQRLWELIGKTPYLNWLLLTKRPEYWDRYLPWRGKLPDNVWLGMTVENQQRADQRLGDMRNSPDGFKFLSLEPLLSAVNVSKYEGLSRWNIWGGESGARARECAEEWLLEGVAQDRRSGTDCFVKQVGDHYTRNGVRVTGLSAKGKKMSEWPEAIRVREFPRETPLLASA